MSSDQGSSPTPPPVATNNPRELGEKQFADSYGRVKHLALMLSSYASGDTRRQMLNAYQTLFTRMEPDTRFTIAVGSSRDRKDIEDMMARAKVSNPERIEFVDPKAGSLTVWARDMMVPLQLTGDPNRTALLEQTPLHNWHDNDSAVPGAICAANPQILLDQDKRIVTDGGDVQSNTKESFVGYYSLAATAKQLANRVEGDPELKSKFVSDFEQRTGKQVMDAHQGVTFPFRMVDRESDNPEALQWALVENPKFKPAELAPHQVTVAQMYEEEARKLFEEKFGKPVTVLGKDDPSTTHVEEPATDHMDMGCTPIDDNTFLVGDPGLAKQIVAGMSYKELDDAERILSKSAGRPVRLPRAGDRNRDNQEDFDAYAKTLTDKGYNVVRVPHAEPGLSRSYISYNNCLMERFTREDGTDVRRVFLPVYGIPKLDDAAIKIWESQNFEVIPMELGSLSQRWGALRCVSNWLDRSPHA
ncbi:hypothetical protein JST97_02180 [bacterium]|nr:hypothetical protein [bacterium]